jgi:hypothetical protein
LAITLVGFVVQLHQLSVTFPVGLAGALELEHAARVPHSARIALPAAAHFAGR